MSTGIPTETDTLAANVLCSEGLPPLPKPSYNTSKVDFNDPSAKLETQPFDTQAAFDVFASHKLSGTDRTLSVNNNTLNLSKKSNEPPLVRLARLKKELSELEYDLSTSSRSNANLKGDSLSFKEQNDMNRMLRTLSNRLDLLDQSNSHGLTIEQQNKLTKEVRRALDGANNNLGDLKGASEVNPSILDVLETRLSVLEARCPPSADIMELSSRLESTEKMLSRVDLVSLDKSAARAKVIRSDLEAAMKARSKLTSISGSEDSKTITFLHDQMTKLDSLSSELPVIAERLKNLSSLHTQTASFATRLSTLERSSIDVERSFRSLEDALKSVEDGTIKNLHVIESNMKLLDERLLSISKVE